jgi:hypothetical protein
MSKDINLDGTEVSIIKALGFGSGEKSGETLASLVSDLAPVELIDTMKGLVTMGYVSCDTASFQTQEEFEKANFHINSGYARELKETLNPSARPQKSRRVRRE